MKHWFNKRFPQYHLLSKSGKFLAWFTFLLGVNWLIWLILQYRSVLPVVDILVNLVFAVFCLIAAYNVFSYRAVGFKQMLLVFALTAVQLQIGQFFINLSGVLSVSIGFGGPGYYFGVNFIGIILFVLAAKNLQIMDKLQRQETFIQDSSEIAEKE
ncbi:hypothetical protein L4G92_05510 [Neisseria sp. ZJ106]|uniref:Uncharacterized protein n=1 Tax=Neisseria lisongii TaxID=2912188 RepID=A0ABY7RI09_9NEIS|nr:hypothetical protein [Neisseria lisongii]MCF7521503.1 hypothetical protein [Neisseria lisongii]WCL71068.1 hypothetical protein PJU73_06830 [Neisseria lisongii]